MEMDKNERAKGRKNYEDMVTEFIYQLWTTLIHGYPIYWEAYIVVNETIFEAFLLSTSFGCRRKDWREHKLKFRCLMMW